LPLPRGRRRPRPLYLQVMASKEIEITIDMGNMFREFQRAIEATCQAPWGGIPGGKRFRCKFCGHKFKPGDQYRAIMTNTDRDIPGGNPLTCQPCYDEHGGIEGLKKLWKKLHDDLPWWAREENR